MPMTKTASYGIIGTERKKKCLQKPPPPRKNKIRIRMNVRLYCVRVVYDARTKTALKFHTRPKMLFASRVHSRPPNEETRNLTPKFGFQPWERFCYTPGYIWNCLWQFSISLSHTTNGECKDHRLAENHWRNTEVNKISSNEILCNYLINTAPFLQIFWVGRPCLPRKSTLGTLILCGIEHRDPAP